MHLLFISTMSSTALGFIFFCAHFVISAIAEPPTFVHESNPEKIFLTDGRIQEIRCEATGSPPISYSWLKSGNLINLTEYFGDRIIKSPDGSNFTFKSFGLADEGIYQCTAENSEGKAMDDKFEVIRAFIEPLPKKHYNLELTGAMPYSIKCPTVASKPRSKYFWKFTNEQSTPSGRPSGVRQFIDINMTNVIANPKGEIFFQYLDDLPNGTDILVCYAENPVLKEYTIGPSYSLRLKWPQGEKKINTTWGEQYYSPETVQLWRGEELKLYCVVSGGNVTEPQWRKINGELDQNRTSSGSSYKKSLIVSNVTYLDAGQYQCSFQGHPTFNKNFTVVVKGAPEWTNGPPKNVNYTKSSKSDVTFDCGATATPAPTFKFYKNGQELENDNFHVAVGSKLTVKGNYDTSAVYQCKAENSIGHVWANFYRSVLP